MPERKKMGIALLAGALILGTSLLSYGEGELYHAPSLEEPAYSSASIPDYPDLAEQSFHIPSYCLEREGSVYLSLKDGVSSEPLYSDYSLSSEEVSSFLEENGLSRMDDIKTLPSVGQYSLTEEGMRLLPSK